jgi:hypothetical protein
MMTQEIKKEKKFQYLNQAKTEGSMVRDFAASHPLPRTMKGN